MSGPALILAAGAAAAVWLLNGPTQGAVDRRRNDLNQGDRRALTLDEVEALARGAIEGHRLNVKPSMAVAIAWTESSFRPWVIGDNGASHGLMQTKLSTALWLHDELHYNGEQLPTKDSLKLPAVSMYYGCCFLDWLSRYKSQTRDADFIMRGYNAGAEGALLGRGRTYAAKVDTAHRDFYSIPVTRAA